MAEGAKWNAGLYNEKHSFVWQMAAGMLELLEAKAGERILDVGCGTGHLTAKIATYGAQVTGVDRSPEMIHQARAAYPALRFEVMDARKLTFPEKFDAVFSNATLHWIKQPEQAVASIAHVLRPGGRFVAEFGGKRNVAAIGDAIAGAWPKAGLPPPVPNPWYYPSLAEYAGLLEEHGLEVTYAILFDRPTPLEDGERGLHNWLEMFGGILTENLPKDQQVRLLEEIQNEARPSLYRDGRWVLDYRRLRIVARKS